MNYKAHQVGGISLTLSATILQHGIPTDSRTLLMTALTIGAGVAGALLPDIDEPSSKYGKRIPHLSGTLKSIAGHRGFFHTPLAIAVLWEGVLLLKGLSVNLSTGSYFILGLVVVLFIGSLSIVWNHRGRLLSTGLIYAVIGYLWIKNYQYISPGTVYEWVLEGVVVGYISHLLMDMTNATGIPLFYPITNKKYHLLTLKTNKDEWIAELIFLIPTVMIVVSAVRQM